jgi:hypothetical protein
MATAYSWKYRRVATDKTATGPLLADLERQADSVRAGVVTTAESGNNLQVGTKLHR